MGKKCLTIKTNLKKMQKIFQVYQNTQASDSDCWQHWVEKNAISYHSTPEGAKKKIETLLEKEIANIPELRKLNPEIPEKSWLEEEELLKNNTAWYTSCNNGEKHYKGTLYDFMEITLED
jgi:hypothetical protein